MFERFTDRARRVVVLAQEEARKLNHNYIGTEHILLGLIQEGEGHAAKSLEELNIDVESVRTEVVEIIGEDNVTEIGSDTIYFIVSVLNQLNLDKIRNNILLKVLPLKV